ncbi:MAG: type II toxin-antitoxin system HicB family antitoxin [Coriobacteriales bacterium]|nr:type II toxin-antitoxin system HicB family antitoxin [Coriobacteriales bacterium]
MNGKHVYTVVLEYNASDPVPYLVYIPDFDGYTQGTSLEDALFMAQDYIELAGVDAQDRGEVVPAPTPPSKIKLTKNQEKALVLVDFDVYRARIENRSVRKSVTIPSWLNMEAESAHINFSATLQEALKQKLGVA